MRSTEPLHDCRGSDGFVRSRQISRLVANPSKPRLVARPSWSGSSKRKLSHGMPCLDDEFTRSREKCRVHAMQSIGLLRLFAMAAMLPSAFATAAPSGLSLAREYSHRIWRVQEGLPESRVQV